MERRIGAETKEYGECVMNHPRLVAAQNKRRAQGVRYRRGDINLKKRPDQRHVKKEFFRRPRWLAATVNGCRDPIFQGSTRRCVRNLFHGSVLSVWDCHRHANGRGGGSTTAPPILPERRCVAATWRAPPPYSTFPRPCDTARACRTSPRTYGLEAQTLAPFS